MSSKKKSWELDQLTKSEFFHEKLHEWELLDVAEHIENVQGEKLDWALKTLGITTNAWDKIIHRGIKPVKVFAHPRILTTIRHATGYYRMLAMVSQKSMKNIRLSVDRYEQDGKFPDTDTAHQICKRLNWIISNLVETDTEINPREFDIWRGMAAGTQAQGSWGNEKGNREEALIKGLILRRLQAGEYLPAGIKIAKERYLSVRFIDQRLIKFGDEPDVAIYRDNQIQCAVEVKGGIDPAGVLERIGAAIKSLSRAIHENPDARTILLLQGVSVTTQAKNELLANQGVIQHWFTVEEMFDEDDSTERDLFFSLLNI